jgi:hypothetical protein
MALDPAADRFSFLGLRWWGWLRQLLFLRRPPRSLRGGDPGDPPSRSFGECLRRPRAARTAIIQLMPNVIFDCDITQFGGREEVNAGRY